MKNTKKQGKFTLFVYQEKPTYYIGVCLEFDLIVEGKNLQETLKHILNASMGYLRTVIKNNYSDDLLNEKPPIKYLKIYQKILKKRMEEIAKAREEENKLIPWDKYFSQDIPYNSSTIKESEMANV